MIRNTQWDDAITILKKVDKTVYPIVDSMLINATYESALQNAARGDFVNAYYLLEKLDYKDSKKLIKEYEKKAFVWRFEGKLSKTYYTRFEKFSINGRITGGKPGTSINVIIICTTPDWTNSGIDRDLSNGSYIGWEFWNLNPVYANKGRGIITIKNYSTGETLAKFEFWIN